MKRFLFLLLIIAINVTLSAQNGTHDLTFNPTDVGFRYGDGPYNTITNPYPYFYRVAVQSDGKILCGGQFTQYNGNPCSGILRLTADGNFDSSFNSAGTGLIGDVNAIVIQADGKIVVGGELFSYNGTAIQNIIRLNADGSLDATFTVNIGSGNVNRVTTLALQPDGKIVIAGNFLPINIIRIDANGVIDSTFNCPEYAFQNDISSLAFQSDGKIIVGGYFTSFGSTTRNRLLRLNTDGSLDTTFDTSVGASDLVRKIVVLADNKILIIGTFAYFNGEYRPLIARLNSNGTLDNSFNPGYFNENGSTTAILSSIRVQQDGKILIGGKFKLHGATPIIANATAAGNIVRLNSGGSRDTSFNTIGADGQVYDIAIQSNTNVITAGLFESFGNIARRRIARSNANGNVDITFNTGTGSNSSVHHMKVLADGKILIAGNFRLYNGVVRNRIAKLNADGTLDMTFNSNLLIDSSILTFEVQPDGKILIGGNFTTVGGISRSLIARLNADCSLDTSFNVGSGFSSNRVNDIALQSDGKIIVGGYFTTFNGVTCNRIVRLNANGSLDTSFNVGTAANDSVSSVMVQSDGKIIVCGNFYSFNGVAREGIIRLNSNGSIDNTFSIGSGLNGTVNCIKELPNGKILIAGLLDTYNGSNIGPMARLNHDGTLDNTFFLPHETAATVRSFVIQPDGHIIAGGTGFEYIYNSLRNVAKMDADGNVDSNFNFNTHLGPNGAIHAIGLQSDSKIILGGDFDAFDGVGRNRMARLNNTSVLGINDYPVDTRDIIVYTENGKLCVNSKNSQLKVVYIYDLNGRLLYENQNIIDSKFVIETIESKNQALIFKLVDKQDKVTVLKTIF